MAKVNLKHSGAVIDQQIDRVLDGSVVVDSTLSALDETSNKPVSGKGIAEAIETASNNIYNLNKGYIAKNQSISFTDGGYIGLNASVGDVISLTPIPLNVATYAIFNCQEGDIVSATGGFTSTGARLVGFIDSSNVLLFVTAIGLLEGTFVAPSGTAKCIVNGIISRSPSAILSTDIEIADWKKSVEESLGNANAYADEVVKSLFNELVVSTNMFNVDTASWDTSISSAGSLVALNGFATSDFIAIKPSTPYTFLSRWVVVWFDKNKQVISASSSNESSVRTLTSPSNAAYVRFSYNYANVTNMHMNEGDVLLPYEEYKLQFNPNYETKGEISYALGVTNLKLQHSVFENPSNLCLIAAKNIWSKDKTPDYNSFLFLDISTQKLYASSNTPDNPQFLCDWNTQLAGGEECQYWMATITKDGDIIFLRDRQRRNPIIYPHDNYANPYVVDFGDDIAPYGWLMSGGVVQFDDGTFVFGDYATHSELDEANNDPRIIWRVSAPYSDSNNWQKAHSFKHVYFSSEISNEPNNEIGHIHAVQYDWYEDVTYCTTGDIDRHCRLWKSMDKGITWSAVEGAVGWKQGDEGTGNTQTIGQKWRFTNMIFTKDYVYWCTDSFRAYHCLYKIQRGEDGVVKAETLEMVINLEIDIDSSMSQATYVSILLRKPYGILIIDRAEPRTDGHLDIKFYDLTNQTLRIIKSFDRANTNASSLDHETRIGLPNQFATLYQPESCEYVLLGGGTIIRPNNTEMFNNSLENYVGGLKLKL